jgi:hypothetical protein
MAKAASSSEKDPEHHSASFESARTLGVPSGCDRLDPSNRKGDQVTTAVRSAGSGAAAAASGLLASGAEECWNNKLLIKLSRIAVLADKAMSHPL